MSFESTFLSDVICPNHPEFVNNPILLKAAVEKPNAFNIPTLFEETLSHLGGIELLNSPGRIEKGRDFIDNSDSKTARVSKKEDKRKNKKGIERVYIKYKLNIYGVEGKIGSLRIGAYNPFKSCVDYFFIPSTDVSSISYNNSNRTQLARRSISSNWSPATDSYNRLEKYRLRTVQELAEIKDTDRSKIELIAINQL